MATEPVTWKREEHTAAKHELLRAFFVKWVSVHSGYFTQTGGGLVRNYDGFAGPGVYADGEPGSPRMIDTGMPSLVTTAMQISSTASGACGLDDCPAQAA